LPRRRAGSWPFWSIPFVAAQTADIRVNRQQGLADNFHKDGQLLPDNFIEAVKKAGFGEDQVNVRKRDGAFFFFMMHALTLGQATITLTGGFQLSNDER
jgi:hypothetical protein